MNVLREITTGAAIGMWLSLGGCDESATSPRVPEDPCADGAAGSKGSTPTKQPGEVCQRDTDCLVAAGHEAECSFRTVTEGGTTKSTQSCLELIPSAEGAGPCVFTRLTNGELSIGTATFDATATSALVCLQSAGLHCDATSKTCVPVGGVGVTCTGSDGCDGVTSDCHYDPATQIQTCRARAQAGESCDAATFCVDGARCLSGTCVALLANGAACERQDQCRSGACTKGVCGASAGATCSP